MQVEQTTLKNKLKTLFIHNSGSNSASVQIWFRAGSALENSSNQGIAHFLEHMFFKGTKKRPGAAIAKAVESFGGEINAFTSFDYTCYYINTPITHLDETVDILMDMVANPLFTESELIPEREVVFEEYRRSIDNPSQFAFKELQKSCFQAGYAHPILGTEKTIKNFSRKQLTDFRNKFYNLSNAMLIVAGDLKHKNKLIQIIQKYKLPAGPASRFGEFKLKNKSTINIHNKEVRQGVLTLTIPAFNYHHNKTPSEDLAINCLAHGESSRFYNELVHNSSLCSTVSGSTMYFQNGGAHFLRFVFPEKNLEQILQKTSEILHEARKSGYSSSEVNKIKNQYVSSKIYEKESIEAFSFSMGHGFAQTGNIHCETEFIDKIKSAKTQEVNHSLIEIFDRQPHLCLQLPKSENKNNYKPILEKFVKALKRETKLEKSSHQLKFEKSKHDPQVKVFTLKNGIKFIYRQNTMTPTFVFHAYMKGGISLETKENNGIYHLITQVQTMGHSGIDYDQIKLELENKSASLNGFSGKNALGLTMHGQTEHSEELFGHFFGTLLRPDFPEKFIQHEKEIVYRVLENQKEDPVKQCFKKFNGYLFNGHAYGFDAIGSKDNVEKFTKNDLKKLYQQRLEQSELLFVYCGDLSFDHVHHLISPYLADISEREFSKTHTKEFISQSPIKEHIHFDREQTQIFMGKRAFSFLQKEDLILKILTTHLSGQGSDLFVEVRDRQGLCYAVQPVHMNALEGGYWGIFIAAGHDKTQKAIDAISGIIRRLSQTGFTAKEFATIKKVIEGQNLISIQTNEDYAALYSVPVLHHLGVDFSKNKQELIKKLKLEDVNKFLKKFLSEEFTIITVGR